MNWLYRIFTRNRTFGAARSPKWNAVRKDFLILNPRCAITNSTKKLAVHHIKPVHLYPEEELNPKNLITLSEKAMGSNIHLIFGHRGNYKKENPSLLEDVKLWRNKLSTK